MMEPTKVRVAIVHPWFPQYRLDFFEQLVPLAAAEGFDVTIFHGATPPEWRARRDSIQRGFAQELPTKFISIFGRHLILKDIRTLFRKPMFDLVILEHAARNLESYAVLARQGGQRVAFWGHGKTYTKKVSKIQENLKYWLARRGSWFFAYTQGGADAVIAHGFPKSQTTILNNSFDTRALTTAVEVVTAQAIDEFSQKHDLRGSTALFIGGLDSSKRLNFLLDSADIVHDEVPEFRLVVCGAGEDEKFLLNKLDERPWLKLIGPVFGDDKALAMASAQILAMPGRVGLVALDSFASGRPIVTTDWPWHAPEFEYLQNNQNALITNNNKAAYASGLHHVLTEESFRQKLVNGATQSAQKYSVEGMVANFIDGLVRWRSMQS